jgi:hypothetical protein
VSFFNGSAWQQLRAECLAAIPAGASATFQRSVPLDEWCNKGAFLVTSCSKTGIVIETAGVEIGSALLTDAEHFLDHAAEHHATLKAWNSPDFWHSPGWSLVTLYYWAFFLSLALTRFVGNTIWFLKREEITNLSILAGAKEQPGAGCLKLKLGNYIGTTERQVFLQPYRSHLHEAVWKTVFELFGRMLAASDELAHPEEYQLLVALRETTHRLTAPWPSNLRNAVNYLPGCGYKEVHKGSDINLVQFLRKRFPMSKSEILSQLGSHLSRLAPNIQAIDDIPLLCKHLLLITLVLSDTATGLQSELIERNSLDSRWRQSRNNFLKAVGVLNNGEIWPFAE